MGGNPNPTTMSHDELYALLKKCGWETDPENIFHEIWGQPFDGLTEKINTTKSASSTSPVTEESSATLTESFPDGTTYTRSYSVFLPNPTKQ